MIRRTTKVAALLLAVAIGTAQAAEPVEKKNIEIGTASLGLTYLPVIIADRKGYFKDEGLNVEIAAFSGGSKALEALMGGSLDVVSGAYSNTLTMAAKGQALVEFVEQIRCPGFALEVSKRKLGQYQSPKSLDGLNVGVSAPGSSTHMVLNFILSKAGLDPDRRVHHRRRHGGGCRVRNAGWPDRRHHEQRPRADHP